MEHIKFIANLVLLLCILGFDNIVIEQKTVQLNSSLSIQIPFDFEFTEDNCIDSHCFNITNKSGSLNIRGEIGQFVNKLYEPSYPIFNITSKENLLNGMKYKKDTGTIFFSPEPEDDQAIHIFSKQYYVYDTINSIIVKLVKPKKVSSGIVGIYAPRLKNGESLSLYAENISFKEEEVVLQILYSLKYK